MTKTNNKKVRPNGNYASRPKGADYKVHCPSECLCVPFIALLSASGCLSVSLPVSHCLPLRLNVSLTAHCPLSILLTVHFSHRLSSKIAASLGRSPFHPRNRRSGGYDLIALSAAHPPLAPLIHPHKRTGEPSVDFSDPQVTAAPALLSGSVAQRFSVAQWLTASQ